MTRGRFAGPTSTAVFKSADAAAQVERGGSEHLRALNLGCADNDLADPWRHCFYLAFLIGRAKSTHSCDAYIEEAEEVGEDEFRQLDDSLRVAGSQIHLMLNSPAKSHWIIRRWFNLVPVPEAPGFDRLVLKAEAAHEVEFIFADHTLNPLLADEVHQRYEAYKVNKPAYYWNMIRGYSPEVVMGRIYTGWREIPALPHEAHLLGYGLDFGFDPDPAAIVAV